MRNLSILLVLLLTLGGCAKTLNVKTESVEREKLELSQPEPISLKPIHWHINEVDGELYFGMTAESYENLSINMERVYGYMRQQKEIINQYKNYYEK